MQGHTGQTAGAVHHRIRPAFPVPETPETWVRKKTEARVPCNKQNKTKARLIDLPVPLDCHPQRQHRQRHREEDRHRNHLLCMKQKPAINHVRVVDSKQTKSSRHFGRFTAHTWPESTTRSEGPNIWRVYLLQEKCHANVKRTRVSGLRSVGDLRGTLVTHRGLKSRRRNCWHWPWGVNRSREGPRCRLRSW